MKATPMRGMGADLADAAVAWLTFCDARREFITQMRLWLATAPPPADVVREMETTQAMLRVLGERVG